MTTEIHKGRAGEFHVYHTGKQQYQVRYYGLVLALTLNLSTARAHASQYHAWKKADPIGFQQFANEIYARRAA